MCVEFQPAFFVTQFSVIIRIFSGFPELFPRVANRIEWLVSICTVSLAF